MCHCKQRPAPLQDMQLLCILFCDSAGGQALPQACGRRFQADLTWPAASANVPGVSTDRMPIMIKRTCNWHYSTDLLCKELQTCQAVSLCHPDMTLAHMKPRRLMTAHGEL